MHAGGRPHGATLGHAGTGVGVAVGDGVGVGVPAGGVGVGVPLGGVGVGVPLGGVGVGVPLGGVGVGVPDTGVPLGVPLGVGVAPGPDETSNSGFIFELSVCVDTVGSSNVGIPEPPSNIATVPDGETKITLEFWSFAVPTVHTPLQK